MAADRQETSRLQVDLSRHEMEAMEETMMLSGLTTKKELFNNAITLFEWAIQEIAKGMVIASMDPKTGDYVRLQMPAFNFVERDRRAKEKNGAVAG